MSFDNRSTMTGRKLILLLLFIFSAGIAPAQQSRTTADLFRNNYIRPGAGTLTINQDPRIDTLISRYILYNKRMNGMEGFRIQIYNSSEKNAREESGKRRAAFIGQFPDLVSYATFDRPSYYKIRVGDYRTRIEGTRDLMMIRRVFPDAILVPDIINFPDLN